MRLITKAAPKQGKESQYTKTPKFNYDRLARLIEKLEAQVINPIGDPDE